MPQVTPDNPRSERRFRPLDIFLWTAAGAGIAYLAIGLLTPFALRDASVGHMGVMWTAFLLRTLAFHACWLLLPLVFLALWKRRRLAAGTLAALMLAAIGTNWRDLAPAARPVVAGPSLRVLSANLFAYSSNHAPLVQEILASDADVLVFQEYNAAWDRSLHAVLNERYPYQSRNPREHCHGNALYSRIEPLEPPENDLILGREGAPQARAVLPLGNQRVVLYGIHTLPPNSLAYFREQCLQISTLLELVKGENDPVIVAGDLNFINASEFGDRFVTAGLSDVHWQAGASRGATWVRSPRTKWLPGIRIDHIFLSRQLGCVRTVVGNGDGSDHRPVLAEIAFRNTP